MTQARRCSSMAQFKSQFRKDMRELTKNIGNAAKDTARDGVRVVKANVPVAFKELRNDIKATPTRTGARIRAGAPHAEPVEVGSRPHMPPIEPLVAWVKLRGMQSLRRRAKKQAPFKYAHVGAALKEHERGGSSSIDAPRQVAFAIALGIKKHGTKPTWFMFRSLPEIYAILNKNAHLWAAKPLSSASGSRQAAREAWAAEDVQ